MRNRRRHRGSSIEGLRLAIDCMPVATREAMLEGVRRYERIIVGAYVDDHGGVCPMLAAHRCGGRTDFLSFAKSWDRFARADGRKRAATQRELRILVTQLQDSLASCSGLELDHAIAEHRALVAAGRRRRARVREEADPRGEIRARRLRRAPRLPFRSMRRRNDAVDAAPAPPAAPATRSAALR
jgi:hypothetical protein